MALPRSRFITRLLIVFSACIVMQQSVPAAAQTFRGGIHGTAEDPSGALLASAEVKAENEGTGLVYSTTTTSAGEFTFPDLPIGSYAVSIKLKNFAPLRVSGVSVLA